MNTSQLGKDTTYYTIASWGRSMLQLLVMPVTIACLSPWDYGYMALVQSIALFMGTLGQLSLMNHGLPRFFSAANTFEEKQSYASTAFFLSRAVLVIIGLLTILCAPFVTRLFDSIGNPLVFTLLIAILAWSNAHSYFSYSLLKWSFRSKRFMTISILQRIFSSAVLLIGLLLLHMQAKGVILIGVFTSLVFGTWALFCVKRYISWRAFSRSKVKKMIVYTLPLLGMNLFAITSRFIDRTFLSSMISLESTGVYSVTVSVSTLFETAVAGFILAWMPHVYSSFEDKNAPRKISYMFSVITFVGVCSIIGLGIWAKPVIEILRPDGSYNSIGIYVPWIVASLVIYVQSMNFSPGPIVTMKSYYQLYAFLIAAGTNILFNSYMIPRYGILGASVATAFSSLLGASFHQYISNRLWFVPNPWKRSFALIMITAGLVSALEAKPKLFGIEEMTLVPSIIITVLGILITFLLFRKKLDESGIITFVSSKLSKSRNLES